MNYHVQTTSGQSISKMLSQRLHDAFRPRTMLCTCHCKQCVSIAKHTHHRAAWPLHRPTQRCPGGRAQQAAQHEVAAAAVAEQRETVGNEAVQWLDDPRDAGEAGQDGHLQVGTRNAARHGVAESIQQHAIASGRNAEQSSWRYEAVKAVRGTKSSAIPHFSATASMQPVYSKLAAAPPPTCAGSTASSSLKKKDSARRDRPSMPCGGSDQKKQFHFILHCHFSRGVCAQQ